MKHRAFASATLAAMALVALPAAAEDLLPVASGNVEDNPRGGAPEVVSTSTTLVREQSSRENRGMLEYDATGFAGASVASATFTGRIAANNAFDNGPRTFNIEVYAADGVITLDDFDAPAVVIGSVSYHPPHDTSIDFSFDATDAVQTILAGGATHIGLRVDPTSDPNFPNLVDTDTVLTIEVGGCAADFDGDGQLALADFVAFRNAYTAGDLRADFDGNGVLTLADFVAYRNAYIAGC